MQFYDMLPYAMPFCGVVFCLIILSYSIWPCVCWALKACCEEFYPILFCASLYDTHFSKSFDLNFILRYSLLFRTKTKQSKDYFPNSLYKNRLKINPRLPTVLEVPDDSNLFRFKTLFDFIRIINLGFIRIKHFF